MDERTGEQTDSARFIHIQMRALYDRASERKRERTRAHLGLEVTAPGLRRDGTLRRRFVRYAAARLRGHTIVPFTRYVAFLGSGGVISADIFTNERHDSNAGFH